MIVDFLIVTLGVLYFIAITAREAEDQ